MNFRRSRGIFVRILSIALVTAGFTQASWAGMVGTDYIVEANAREASLARVEALLASDDVATQLQSLGVDKAVIQDRLQGLTNTELASLAGQIDQQVAGGDALALIGAVFLVLLILELVGVTDIFKSI
ncbi:MAG: PA2779 family protein [Gammaproteobacteria bacterium]|mgnify:FL=1|jgi:hypothetical protein|nr:PA2779 family protein [Gammaproteobacteria bacterium]